MKYLILGLVTESGQQLPGPDLEAWMQEIGAWYEKWGSSGKLVDPGHQLDAVDKVKTIRAGGVFDGVGVVEVNIPKSPPCGDPKLCISQRLTLSAPWLSHSSEVPAANSAATGWKSSGVAWLEMLVSPTTTLAVRLCCCKVVRILCMEVGIWVIDARIWVSVGPVKIENGYQ